MTTQNDTFEPKPVTPAFLKLLKLCPLRPISSDEECDFVRQKMRSFSVFPVLGEGEREFIAVLKTLIERYEAEQKPASRTAKQKKQVKFESTGSPSDNLRTLMQANSLTQMGLARELPTLIHQSAISEVLKGKRELTTAQVFGLADYFGVDPRLFVSVEGGKTD